MKRQALNFGWLSLEQVVRLLSGLFVMTLAARHLGPDRFAAYAYVFALFTLLNPLTMLGLNPVILRVVPQDPGAGGRIVGAAIFLRLAGALLAAAILAGWGAGGLAPSGVTLAMLLVVSVGFLAAPAESLFAALQAGETVRGIAILRTVIAAAFAAGTLALVATGAGVESFIAMRSGEVLLLGAAAVFAFTLAPTVKPKLPSWAELRAALGEGAPFLCAAFASLIYLRIDQVMLGTMATPGELADYAIAARLSEMAMFVPALLQSVCYARLVVAQTGPDGGQAARRSLFAVFAGAGWLVAIGVALSAQLLLVPVFGSAYAGAVPMTLILAFGLPFGFLAVALQMVLNIEGKRWLVPAMAGLAALLNVALNLVLIPRMGGNGAAIATLAAATASGLLPALIHRPIRAIGRDMLAGLNPLTLATRIDAIAGDLKPRVLKP